MDAEQNNDKAHLQFDHPDPRFFAAIMAHFLHLDRNMWGRVQYLSIVQAGAFSSAYAVWDHRLLGALIFTLALVLTMVIFFLAKRDEAIRDANRPLIEKLGNLLSTPCVDGNVSPFTTDPTPKWPAPFRGRSLNVLVFRLFMLIDLIGLSKFAFLG